MFTLLDEKTTVEFLVQDGAEVHKGQLMAKVHGDIRTLLWCHEGGDFYDNPGDLFLIKAGTVRVDSETEKKYQGKGNFLYPA